MSTVVHFLGMPLSEFTTLDDNEAFPLSEQAVVHVCEEEAHEATFTVLCLLSFLSRMAIVEGVPLG